MARQASLSSLRREVGRLAVPALGALAAEPLVSLVDTGFVATLGRIPLAALGVDAAILGLAFVAFNFLQYGVTPLIGGALGRGDDAAIGRATRHALILGGLIGLTTSAVLILGAPFLLGLMAAPTEVLPDATAYLRIRAISGAFVLTVMVGHGVFRGLQDTRTPLAITLGLNVVNLVLDAVFIFGLGTGLVGAAWASVIAQGSGAIWFLVALRRRGIPLVGDIDRSEMAALIRVGGDLVVRTASLVLTLTIATRVAASLGAATVAAHQVATQVFLVLGLGIDGLAIAGQSMISVRLGAGESSEARRVGDLLLRWGAIAGVTLGAALFLVRGPVAAMFSSDPATAAIAEEFLAWVAALLVPGALVFTWDGIYLGASRFRFLAVSTFVAAAGAIAYLAMRPPWPFGTGPHQVWAGILLLVVLRGIPQAIDYAGSGASSANSG